MQTVNRRIFVSVKAGVDPTWQTHTLRVEHPLLKHLPDMMTAELLDDNGKRTNRYFLVGI